MPSIQTIKSVFESLMFVYGEPLTVKQAADLMKIDQSEAYAYFKELQAEYKEKGGGIVIREIDKAFQFCTVSENREYIERLLNPIKKKRLSQSALEVLAIVAYNQPVTRIDVEGIRGIKCDRMLESLIDKGLLQEAGRSTAVGRPILYSTTRLFLEHFGLESIEDLPDIEGFNEYLLSHG